MVWPFQLFRSRNKLSCIIKIDMLRFKLRANEPFEELYALTLCFGLACVALDPPGKAIKHYQGFPISIPAGIILIQDLNVRCERITKLFGIRKLVGPSIGFRPTVCPSAFTILADWAIKVFRKMGERVMLTIRVSMGALCAKDATSLARPFSRP